MLFNHLNCNVIVWIETRVSIFLMAVSDVLPGIEVSLGRFPPHKSPGSSNSIASSGRPFASLLFRRLAGGGSFFRGFPFRWSFTICALSGSLPDLAGHNNSLQGRSSVRMRPPARYLFLYCPMALAEPIHISAGHSASQGYRLDFLQDVADQSHQMLSSGRPCPLSGRWPYLQNPTNPALQPPMWIPTTNIQKALFQLSRTPRWRRMLFSHLKYNEVAWIGTHVSIFLMVVFDVLLGILQVLLGL